jgi:hypothetical protein
MTCKDLDEDCFSIAAEGGCLACWLYDPAKGMCPFLRSAQQVFFSAAIEPNNWDVDSIEH